MGERGWGQIDPFRPRKSTLKMPSLIRVKYVFVRTFFTLMLRNFCVIFTDHHADVGACLVLIYHYGGKKTKDRNLNCRCHLNDITRDSIFYDIVGLGATWIFFRFFLGFVNIEEMGYLLSL